MSVLGTIQWLVALVATLYGLLAPVCVWLVHVSLLPFRLLSWAPALDDHVREHVNTFAVITISMLLRTCLEHIKQKAGPDSMKLFHYLPRLDRAVFALCMWLAVGTMSYIFLSLWVALTLAAPRHKECGGALALLAIAIIILTFYLELPAHHRFKFLVVFVFIAVQSSYGTVLYILDGYNLSKRRPIGQHGQQAQLGLRGLRGLRGQQGEQALLGQMGQMSLLGQIGQMGQMGLFALLGQNAPNAENSENSENTEKREKRKKRKKGQSL